MQNDLFSDSAAESQPIDHALGNELIREHRGFLPAEQADRTFKQLLREIPWRQETIMIAGIERPVPRLQCWMGDATSAYGYSGLALQPQPWTETVAELRDAVMAYSGCRFNSVLLNLYRDGQDSVSWHADDETELGRNPVIASLNLGAERQFQLRPKDSLDSTRVRLSLQNGSLLLMGKTIQNNWLHQVPKTRKDVGPRINLTFRLVEAKSG